MTIIIIKILSLRESLPNLALFAFFFIRISYLTTIININIKHLVSGNEFLLSDYMQYEWVFIL